MANIESGYDILGNIAIVKFKRGAKIGEKKKFALKFFKNNKSVRSVFEKTGKFKGRLRTLKTKFIAGENTKEALYRENGCAFRLNIDDCYFSPRLASERLDISRKVKKGEKVLVMFGGVAPFAIIIAKLSKAGKVLSVELNRNCNKYAEQNVKMNKVNVELVQGDVRRKVPKLREKFDRIIMARPNLKDSFLDVAFPVVKKGGIIHYYGFYPEDELEEMKELIFSEAKNAGKKIKIIGIKKAGDIGVRKFRYRADLRVLN
ncbi:MAG: hypothetical protein Q8L29_01075 [archaeon]|nr:hypothetical protein [archaeon]